MPLRRVSALKATTIHLAQMHSVNAYYQIHQHQLHPLGLPDDVLIEMETASSRVFILCFASSIPETSFSHLIHLHSIHFLLIAYYMENTVLGSFTEELFLGGH